jgi:hypothetical protein
MEPTRSQDEETFWRRFVLPEEDRQCPWDGIGYRWFRSPNVVAIEQYRHQLKDHPDHGGNEAG